MKKYLLKWFIYFMITGLVSAGAASWVIALVTGAAYLSVFKLTLVVTYVLMLIFGAYKTFKK